MYPPCGTTWGLPLAVPACLCGGLCRAVGLVSRRCSTGLVAHGGEIGLGGFEVQAYGGLGGADERGREGSVGE